MKKKKLLRKLSQMERALRDYNQDRARHARELNELRERNRRVETVVGSGVVLMLNDLASHVGLDGEVGITVEHSREQHNVTTVEHGVQYVPGLETYNVTYRASDGREWHNGVPEERWKV